ncbi:MAG TPA: DUF2905 domain-containing protein [Candidatus Omnitrophica bacterium]|nr:DUF2905 domain-containing protein [Candidatus Omnitrophota bacterium]
MPKILIFIGIGFIVLGLLWNFLVKIPFLGRMPGDILIQKKNLTFYFPLTTCILASLILSLILWVFSKR